MRFLPVMSSFDGTVFNGAVAQDRVVDEGDTLAHQGTYSLSDTFSSGPGARRAGM